MYKRLHWEFVTMTNLKASKNQFKNKSHAFVILSAQYSTGKLFGQISKGLAFLSAYLLISVSAPSIAFINQQVVLEEREPEAATGIDQKARVEAKSFMVAAANPHAANAGKRIIEQGGSAIDAAIAVQAMLTLVEPQSSGIGGGAFILYWDNTSKQLYTFDGREVAPKKAHANIFMQNGQSMKWRDAVVGGNSVGVPGVLKALEKAHMQFGKLPWNALFDDSIKLSNDGFEVSERLAKLLAYDLHPGLNKFADSNTYFKPNGEALSAGFLRKNPKLANSLALIAKQGSQAFYKGPLAEKMAIAVQNADINPGLLDVQDLSDYEAIARQPMCNPYRNYKICSMAPPSSGGVSVYQILKALEKFDLKKYAPDSAEFVHLFTQSTSLAFADRAHYIADLDFLDMSAEPLVSSQYIAQRANKISLDTKFEKATPGMPFVNAQFGKDNAYELDSTSHVSIIDKQGNALSMTSSIEFMFGSGIMVEGFLLNNQLTDFSLNPIKDDKIVLNAVAPMKRPRSAMSPTMVFDENDELILVLGSPGGSRIINYVAQTLINVLDFDMEIQQAIDFPRISNRNGSTALEKGSQLVDLKASLESKGHQVRVVDLNSGLHGIQFKNGYMLGGADPRREGIATGQ